MSGSFDFRIITLRPITWRTSIEALTEGGSLVESRSLKLSALATQPTGLFSQINKKNSEVKFHINIVSQQHNRAYVYEDGKKSAVGLLKLYIPGQVSHYDCPTDAFVSGGFSLTEDNWSDIWKRITVGNKCSCEITLTLTDLDLDLSSSNDDSWDPQQSQVSIQGVEINFIYDLNV